MKKFLVLYRAPTSAFEQMNKPRQSSRRPGWMRGWPGARRRPRRFVDMGAPLGKSLRVTKGGAAPNTNDLGGFSILQAESKEALAETLKGHPHFMMPDGSIEIVEFIADAGHVKGVARRAARVGAKRLTELGRAVAQGSW